MGLFIYHKEAVHVSVPDIFDIIMITHPTPSHSDIAMTPTKRNLSTLKYKCTFIHVDKCTIENY